MIKIDVKVMHKTAGAVLVSPSGDDDDQVWVPLASCSGAEDVLPGQTIELELSEELATEKGLV